MSRLIRASVASVLALLVVTVVMAQQVPQTGPEHARLKALAGTWDAVVKFGEGESKGVMTYKMDLGGLWLVGDFVSETDDFKGKGLDSYDPVKKKYIGIWVDSMSPSPMVMEGSYDAASKTTTMIGTGPGFDGGPAKYRTVTQEVSADKLGFTMFITGSDNQEQQMLHITYTRRK